MRKHSIVTSIYLAVFFSLVGWTPTSAGPGKTLPGHHD